MSEQTYLVVQFWELHLHLVPVEVVVLCLLAHRGMRSLNCHATEYAS